MSESEQIKKVKESGRIPVHVAIIMDGNGRWAKSKGLSRVEGHIKGTKVLKSIVELAARLGIKYLTIFAFSTENWKRPSKEISSLMKLTVTAINDFINDLDKGGIRVKTIGNLSRLPVVTRRSIEKCKENTKHNANLILTVAMNYGSRLEITDAVKKIASQIVSREKEIKDINEKLIDESLFTNGLPDPDLLIRTGGNHRLSNFLLWQIAYSEILIFDEYWPNFDNSLFLKAISDFQKRERRYGMISEQLKKRKKTQ